MGRCTVIVIAVIIAVAVELVSCCPGGGGGGGGPSIPRSNSGRPFGLNVNDNVEVWPRYDTSRDIVGVGVEVRPNSDLDLRLQGGVGGRELLNGQIRRPEANLEAEYRQNKNVRWTAGVGVGRRGDPSANVGLQIKFRRRRSSSSTDSEEERSLMLFSIFDLNQDGKIDVVDWSTEGGKVVSFSDMIAAHDTDGDEKLSLDEFRAIPTLPDLGLDLALDLDEDVQEDKGTPASPAKDQD